MINLYELVEAASGQLLGEPAAQLFDDFCIDPDKARPGQLFVTLRAERGDTQQYIKQAIDNGVSGIICTRPPEIQTNNVSVVLVRDTVDALLAWTQYILGKFGTKVIGVAGVAGKTVAADAIRRVLSTQHSVYTNTAAGSGRLSIPLALAKLKSTDKFAIVKLGTTEIGEMAAMVQAVQPEAAVVTHVGEYYSHHFESAQEVAGEMRFLTDYLPPSGLSVLNYDDDQVRQLNDATRATVKTVGITSFGADMIAYNVTTDSEKTAFDVRSGSERYTGQEVKLFGKYHLYGVLAALCVGEHYGISVADGLKALNGMPPLPGRLNRLKGMGDAFIVDDSYSANLRSTLGVLDWLTAVKTDDQRVFVVFGDMDHLGANSVLAHRIIGEHVASVADVLVTCGTTASVTARAALDRGMSGQRVHATYTPNDAAHILLEKYELSSNDIVAIKGGSQSRMEVVTAMLLADSADREKLVRQDVIWDKMMIAHPSRLTWVEIDYDAIAGNVRRLKSLIGDEVTLMAVVKADAYGHGAVMTARTALLNGATYLGVSSVQEAVVLRDAGIDAPILVMNYTPPYMVRQAIRQGLALTVYDLETARVYDRIAREVGAMLRVHIKVDTGMGRLGTLPGDMMQLFRYMLNMQNLDIEGIYTHFSSADTNPTYTQKQITQFRDIVRPIQATTGFKFKYIHACNSAGTLAHKDGHFSLVRPGLAMYGMHPSDTVKLPEGFRPALAWKTMVAQVKTLPPGHPVGYGNTYTTKERETIAVLPVGYGDGFRRAPDNWGEVLVHGRRAPLIGRVSMEKTVINITHIPDVAVGDEVVLLGTQGNETITAEEVAARIGTINYEVTCAALARVPRR